MTCYICGGKLERIVTDLPFKVDDNRIVVIKNMPVLQCRNCSEYVIEDAVMEKTDVILSRVDTSARTPRSSATSRKQRLDRLAVQLEKVQANRRWEETRA